MPPQKASPSALLAPNLITGNRPTSQLHERRGCVAAPAAATSLPPTLFLPRCHGSTIVHTGFTCAASIFPLTELISLLLSISTTSRWTACLRSLLAPRQARFLALPLTGHLRGAFVPLSVSSLLAPLKLPPSSTPEESHAH